MKDINFIVKDNSSIELSPTATMPPVLHEALAILLFNQDIESMRPISADGKGIYHMFLNWNSNTLHNYRDELSAIGTTLANILQETYPEVVDVVFTEVSTKTAIELTITIQTEQGEDITTSLYTRSTV